MLKPFLVTGYVQYMTYAASTVNRVQLAETAEEAIEAVAVKTPNYKYVLTAVEVRNARWLDNLTKIWRG